MDHQRDGPDVSAIQQVLLATSGGIPGGDPSYASVGLLMHCDGTNGSTSFIDNSSHAQALTANGNAQLSTTNPKFGTACGLFDGTGDYVSMTAQPTYLAPANGDWTTEAWIAPVAFTTIGVIHATRPPGADRGFQFQVTTGGKLQLVCWDASSNAYVSITSTASIATGGTYTHVAATRGGNVYTMWVNGTADGTTTNATVMGPTGGTSVVGRDPTTTAREFNGRIDELRYTVGVCRYTGTFTPTGPFPNF